MRCYILFFLFTLNLTLVGCAGPQVAEHQSRYSLAQPIRVGSADVMVSLLGYAQKGQEGTLVEDPGWREYFLEIENLSTIGFTINNVKLLNSQGRYVDSATSYEQVIAPPHAGTEVAGEVAGTAAGIAAGQVIPFGGTILGVFQGAASATSKETRVKNRRIFISRVLKNVELAPSGMVVGSAFLPNVPQPRTLVVDLARNGASHRITIPLSTKKP